MSAEREVIVDFEMCDHCGSDQIAITTECKDEGFFFDGDRAECKECGNKGGVSCDSETPLWINWEGVEETEEEKRRNTSLNVHLRMTLRGVQGGYDISFLTLEHLTPKCG